MKLEMICTGEEVLAGQIVDTNAAWVADILMEQGIEMQRRITVGDRLADLVEAFKERSQYADVIIVNGGLGPTTDDMSAQAMALAKGEPLLENKEWSQHIRDWFAKNNRIMPESNLKQAMLPESAIMVDNPVGTACGFRVKLNNAWLFFTPGVPFELKQMIHEQFIPFIKQTYHLDEKVKLKKLLTLGAGESALAQIIEPLAVPAGITVGYRSSMPHIEIKLFARGEAAIAELPNFTQLVKERIGESVVAEDYPTLAEALHHKLLSTQYTLALAESCTGGMIASQLIDFAGSSAYLKHSVVSYSNEAKMTLLGVPQTTLETYGAVSTQTAEAMAQGARAVLDSDFALATSGIAGPDGGSAEKPVGTITIALAYRDGVVSQQLQLPRRSRNLVRKLTCAIAYDMLRRKLEQKPVIADYSSYQRVN